MILRWSGLWDEDAVVFVASKFAQQLSEIRRGHFDSLARLEAGGQSSSDGVLTHHKLLLPQHGKLVKGTGAEIGLGEAGVCGTR